MSNKGNNNNTPRGIHRFVEAIDPEREAVIKKRIRELKHQVKELQECVIVCKWPSENETSPILDIGSILRALIALDSILYLASAGYIGAINGLLRQLYEFNIWSKIGLIDNADIVAKATNEFYTSNDIHLSHYLKRIRYNLPGVTSEEARQIVTNTGRTIMDTYALITHASELAQQCPLPTNDFYDQWNLCLNEVVLHYNCLLKIISSYIRKQEKIAFSESHAEGSPLNEETSTLTLDPPILHSIRASFWLTKLIEFTNTIEKWYPSSKKEKLLHEIFAADWSIS